MFSLCISPGCENNDTQHTLHQFIRTGDTAVKEQSQYRIHKHEQHHTDHKGHTQKADIIADLFDRTSSFQYSRFHRSRLPFPCRTPQGRPAVDRFMGSDFIIFHMSWDQTANLYN